MKHVAAGLFRYGDTLVKGRTGKYHRSMGRQTLTPAQLAKGEKIFIKNMKNLQEKNNSFFLSVIQKDPA